MILTLEPRRAHEKFFFSPGLFSSKVVIRRGEVEHNFKGHNFGNSLAVQWLGLDTFTAGTWIQSLVRELRSYMLHGPQKGREKQKSWCLSMREHPWESAFRLT